MPHARHGIGFESARAPPDARIVVGTPDDVVAEIRAFAEAVSTASVRGPRATARADLTAIAEEVLPRASAPLVGDDGAPTLRERLGLPRRASRHTRSEVSA